MSEWKEYVWCDGLWKREDIRGYGREVVHYYTTYDGYGNKIDMEPNNDDWWTSCPEVIDEWEAPNGCSFEPEDECNFEIPKKRIVLVKEENGKVIARVHRDLLPASPEDVEEYIREAESLEDVAEKIRELEELWKKDAYEYWKVLRTITPVKAGVRE